MTPRTSAPVVVGMDHEADTAELLDHAAREAEERRAPLHILHVLVTPTPYADELAPSFEDPRRLRAARDRIEPLAQEVRRRHPGLVVTSRVATGSAAAPLVLESRTAQLTVVGQGRRGRLTHALLGSTATQVVAHAAGEVDVVPGRLPTAVATGPVVVGVDGSAASQDVLAAAFARADRGGVPLVAVMAWSMPPITDLGAETEWYEDADAAQVQVEDAARRLLSECLSGWTAKFPGTTVSRVLRHGFDPAARLVEVAVEQGASRIVVGSRGRGGFTGLLMGSVSQALASRAPVPITVVHPPQR